MRQFVDRRPNPRGKSLANRQIMIHAGREAARSYAVGSSDQDEAEALAETRLAESIGLTYSVVVTEPVGGNEEVTVTITVPTADAALVSNPLTGMFGAELVFGGDIEAQVTMRAEST